MSSRDWTLDEQLRLQAPVTKAASFDSASLDLGSGFAPDGIGIPVQGVVNISSLDLSDLDETYTFVLQESSDNSSFTAIGAVSPTAAAAGPFAVGGFLKQRYCRLVMTAGGTTPSITYEAWLSPVLR